MVHLLLALAAPFLCHLYLKRSLALVVCRRTNRRRRYKTTLCKDKLSHLERFKKRKKIVLDIWHFLSAVKLQKAKTENKKIKFLLQMNSLSAIFIIKYLIKRDYCVLGKNKITAVHLWRAPNHFLFYLVTSQSCQISSFKVAKFVQAIKSGR